MADENSAPLAPTAKPTAESSATPAAPARPAPAKPATAAKPAVPPKPAPVQKPESSASALPSDLKRVTGHEVESLAGTNEVAPKGGVPKVVDHVGEVTFANIDKLTTVELLAADTLKEFAKWQFEQLKKLQEKTRESGYSHENGPSWFDGLKPLATKFAITLVYVALLLWVVWPIGVAIATRAIGNKVKLEEKDLTKLASDIASQVKSPAPIINTTEVKAVPLADVTSAVQAAGVANHNAVIAEFGKLSDQNTALQTEVGNVAKQTTGKAIILGVIGSLKAGDVTFNDGKKVLKVGEDKEGFFRLRLQSPAPVDGN